MHTINNRSHRLWRMYGIGIREKEIIALSMLGQLVTGKIFPHPAWW
jgi:hypothetical protein